MDDCRPENINGQVFCASWLFVPRSSRDPVVDFLPSLSIQPALYALQQNRQSQNRHPQEGQWKQDQAGAPQIVSSADPTGAGQEGESGER